MWKTRRDRRDVRCATSGRAGRVPCEDDGRAVRPVPAAAARPGTRQVAEALDPVLVPLGFATGQVGGDGARGQVIFCRGDIGTSDGACVDVVVDLEATPHWQITDVRFWGYTSDRWHLAI